MNDQAALKRYAKGRDPEAFRVLVERYEQLVYAAARRRLGRREDVDDAVQLTFLKLARGAGTIRRSLAAWLYTTAVNTANDMIRRDAARRRHEALAAPAEMVADDAEMEAWHSVTLHVDAAILELSPEDRMVIVEHFLRNRTYGELAEEMAVSSQTVMRRVHGAVDRLREILARGGCAVVPAFFAGGLGTLGQAAVPAAVSAELVKIGLAGARGVTGMSLANKAGLAATVAVVVAIALLVFFMRSGGSGPPTGMVATRGPASLPATRRSVVVPLTAAQETRARELLYTLRNSVVFVKEEETYAAVKELSEMGRAAVPEICAELDRATGDGELRTVGFTLRIIHDARAIPALAAALGRTRVMASDCGGNVFDRDVWQFVTDHRSMGRDPEQYPEIDVPRADREFVAALAELSGTSVSSLQAYVAGNNARARDVEEQRSMDMRAWMDWWDLHAGELATTEELAAMKLPRPAGDIVAAAGEAKFGPLFPVGNGNLTAVQEVVLFNMDLADRLSGIDFDTGRTFQFLEGAPPDFKLATGYRPWFEKTGIDATVSELITNYREEQQGAPEKLFYILAATDLLGWQIDNARWETIAEEAKSGRPIDLGTAGLSSRIEPRELRELKYPATYLFRTREGGGGIVQLLESSQDSASVRFRYRMFEGTQVKAVAPTPAAVPAKVHFGEPRQVALASPHSDDPAALSLASGETRPVPLKPEESLGEAGMDWMASWGGDVAPQPQKEGKLFALMGVDMQMCAVSTEAWEKLPAEQVETIVSRRQAESRMNGMYLREGVQKEPATYLFKTRKGVVGILQMMGMTETPQTMTVRYKMVEPD